MNAILLALLISGSPEPVKAVEQHRVEVRVTTEDKLELPGVTVVIRRPGSERTAVTDVQGTAVFEKLAAAAYDIDVELEGFRGAKKRLALGADVTLSVALSLETTGEIGFTCGLSAPSELGVTVFTRNMLDLLPLP